MKRVVVLVLVALAAVLGETSYCVVVQGPVAFQVFVLVAVVRYAAERVRVEVAVRGSFGAVFAAEWAKTVGRVPVAAPAAAGGGVT